MTSFGTCRDTCPTTTRSRIQRALQHAGYGHCEPTPDSLTECFLDFVEAGIWRDLDLEEAEGLPLDDMIRALERLK